MFEFAEGESSHLPRMEGELYKHIIGWREIVSTVSHAIHRARADLKGPRCPSGSFIFVGPSGVDKTELSKTLTEFFFGEGNALIQISIGEFYDRSVAPRFFGASPGYVDYGEGGQPAEKVHRRPFSAMPFDEIEGAHKGIYNTSLRVLEDDRLTNSQG